MSFDDGLRLLIPWLRELGRLDPVPPEFRGDAVVSIAEPRQFGSDHGDLADRILDAAGGSC